MRYAIGIDLGGTNIKYALVAEDGKILFESITPTQAEQSRDVVINNLEYCCQQLLEIANEKDLEISGIGIGTPGIIDNGLVLGGAENLPEWESLPLGGILNRRLNQDVYVDNDANMMGLAEVRYGEADDVDDAVFLTIGTGVGGAMVLNGKLYGGHRNRGAELGHIIVNPNGELCDCGAKGCLEAHASVTALIRDYKKMLRGGKKTISDTIDGMYIVQQYKKNEAEAIEALNMHFDYLAMGVASYINVFSPQKVIIGGGISEAGAFYIEEVQKRALKMAMNETSVFSRIVKAHLGNKAGFIGAAALVFDQSKVNETARCE